MDVKRIERELQIKLNIRLKEGTAKNTNDAVQKARRNRRKQRPKKDTKKSKSLIQLLTIEPVVDHKKCSFIKCRNDKEKHVNIYCYLNPNRKTITFLNRPYGKINVTNLENNIQKQTNGIRITKNRKYLNVHLQYQNSSTSKRKLAKKQKYASYLLPNDLKEALAKNEVIEGVVRINAKNNKEAYITNAEEKDSDYLITSIVDRNRALEGDVVYLKLKPKEEWRDNYKTASIVYIKERVHSRKAIGYLTPSFNHQAGILIPRDARLPRLKIPRTSLPANFVENNKSYEKVLFFAQIVGWNDPKFAEGIILEQLGIDDELEAQNKALLLEHNIDTSAIPDSALNDIKLPETIPESEISAREDIRKDCVFTIDPLTAKDLDDAMSLKTLPNGNIEIGVHIADVTHYIPEKSLLDDLVSEKATSIYLVNRVYHMLPTALCLHCSLLPDKDSLAFSVFWEFNKDAEIIGHRFARTVMRSCVQLAYEHAQMMIEEPDKVFEEHELPPICNGFNNETISNIVNTLQSIAVKLRAKRFANGALRIDQPKITFKLSPLEQVPIEISTYESKDANKLIEEFMLLANQTVAQKILKDFPDIAFLRNHQPPFQRVLTETQKTLKGHNIDFKIDSGADIQASLWKIDSNCSNGEAHAIVLSYLLTKAMKRATYICAGCCSDYRHYALSIPTYTHFTSPIRRYADIMVHRLLAACLGYRAKPKWSKNYVQEIAHNCNTQKNLSKKAQDASIDLYLAYFVEKNQPVIKKAVVCDVKDRSFEIIVIGTGTTIRMPFNNLGEDIICEIEREAEAVSKVTVIFLAENDLPALEQEIRLFQVVHVNLTRRSKSTKLSAQLIRPQ